MKSRDKRRRAKSRVAKAEAWLAAYQRKHGAAPTPEIRRAVEHAKAERRELGR